MEAIFFKDFGDVCYVYGGLYIIHAPNGGAIKLAYGWPTNKVDSHEHGSCDRWKCFIIRRNSLSHTFMETFDKFNNDPKSRLYIFNKYYRKIGDYEFELNPSPQVDILEFPIRIVYDCFKPSSNDTINSFQENVTGLEQKFSHKLDKIKAKHQEEIDKLKVQHQEEIDEILSTFLQYFSNIQDKFAELQFNDNYQSNINRNFPHFIEEDSEEDS